MARRSERRADRRIGARQRCGRIGVCALGLLVATLFLSSTFVTAAPLAGASPLADGADGDVADADAAETKKKAHVDAAAVYFGNAKHWSKPAEVDPDLVYAEIPEYRKIVEDELEPDDPKYQLLLSKASKRFLAAVAKAARDAGHDMVARSGSIQNVEDVPDLTQSVIDRL